jgi:hypothetical protein
MSDGINDGLGGHRNYQTLWDDWQEQCQRANQLGWDLRAVQADNDRLIVALSEAEQGIFAAWQMLSTIYESEPSADRKKARDRAATDLAAVRAILARYPYWRKQG